MPCLSPVCIGRDKDLKWGKPEPCGLALLPLSRWSRSHSMSLTSKPNLPASFSPVWLPSQGTMAAKQVPGAIALKTLPNLGLIMFSALCSYKNSVISPLKESRLIRHGLPFAGPFQFPVITLPLGPEMWLQGQKSG